MLDRIRQLERDGDARYKGLAAAWHVVRLDYGIAFLLFALATLLSLVYLLANLGGRFVLDDSYVTLTMARNLLHFGRLTFDGQAARYAGTSPLHVALVALLTLLTHRVEVAAILLGVVTFGAASIFAYYWSKEVTQSRRIGALSGLLMVTSSWMVFDALSGLETMLFIMLLLIALYLFERDKVGFGIPLGLSVTVRSDAWFFIAGLAAFALIRYAARRDFGVLRRMVTGAGLCALLVILFFSFNQLAIGALMPNPGLLHGYFLGEIALPLEEKLALLAAGLKTFYGRQIMFLPPIIALGLIFARRFWSRYYVLLAVPLFYLAYLIMFPGSIADGWGRYQHVFMPVLALAISEASFVLARLVGTRFGIVSSFLPRWIPGVAIAALLALNQIVSLANGFRTYAAGIRSTASVGEQVARYVRRYTQPGDLIATHDIGTLGYYSGRPILDLTGRADRAAVRLYRDSVSRQPIPLPERRVLDYLRERNPRFLVIFGEWKRYLNFDPDSLPARFTFLGASQPVYPSRTRSYRLYLVKNDGR